MVEKSLCPVCGKRNMIRKDDMKGRYVLTCGSCGARRGPLKEDNKKGVI